jgi:hypothetical protein
VKAQKKTPKMIAPKHCECVENVNEKMAEAGQNQRIAASFGLREGHFVARAVIETERVDSKRRNRPPRLVATYCPFCGQEYPR